MLVVSVVVVLVAVAAMLAIGGRIMEDRLDDRVDEVTKDFDASLNRFREDVRRELDARAAQGGLGAAPTPTPTVFPTPTPEATETPTPEGDGSVTPTPTASVDDTLPDPESTPGEIPRP